MPKFIVLHSAYGLDDPILQFAEQLRRLGHAVEAPDLYDGLTASGDASSAIALRDSIGIPTILARARHILRQSDSETILIGFSMGGALAHHTVCSRRAAAKGLVLLDNISPFDDVIPVPASVHVSANDPYLLPDLDSIRKVCARSTGVELFVYEGNRHMPALPGTRDYDKAIAGVVWQRVSAFLGGAGPPIRPPV